MRCEYAEEDTVGIERNQVSSVFKVLPLLRCNATALLPVFIFVAVPDLLPRRFARPAQGFAAVWYLVFAILSIPLAAFRGLEGIELLLIGFVLLGAWPCVAAMRKLQGSEQ